jgi:aspartyl-tRNA(Asn)/glutamyl-tRNA(Gln) amidotransferase subunit B
LNKLNTKLFCGCSTKYHDSEPNTHVCPVCLGLPGSLPVINEKAVEYAMKIGLALNCSIVEQTQFHRKNYYYPDLPKGFQTTQYDFPIAGEGKIVIEGEDGERVIGITRAHIEEDPGRLQHIGSIDKSKGTLINYNRSGMTLIEIVSEPDMRSPKEARRYLDKLRSILDYLDVFDGDLEGAMRVDANVSVFMGERVEVKNISSFKGAERALLYEIMRQKNHIRRGGEITLETRHFDEARGVTLSMRTKETENDYRYFPEPDLVPLRVADRVPEILKTLPELPDAKRERFVKEYGIIDMHARAAVTDQDIADLFETVTLGENVSPNNAAVWVIDILKGELNYRDVIIRVTKTEKREIESQNQCKWPLYKSMTLKLYRKKYVDTVPEIESGNIIKTIQLVKEKKITEQSGVEIIRTMLDNGGKPQDIVKEKGLLKVADDIVATAVEEAIAENPEAVTDFHAGKEKSMNFLVGKVMQKTKGRADAREAREKLITKLNE